MSEPALVDIFKQEAEEILKELETDIVNLEEENDPEIVNRVFRYVHTLKGSSGIAGLTEISDFTHKVESLLDRVRDGKLEIGKRLIDILLASIDWIRLTIFEDQQGLDMDVMRDDILNSISEYAISKPCVLKFKDQYLMWYSYRGESYRIGFATSENGIDWIRKDEIVGIDVSKEGWDSEMICYAHVFEHNDYLYMLYNGNGYGATGLGLAKMEISKLEEII